VTRDRLGAYATSTKNLTGLALAVVGVLLTLIGVLGPLWPLVIPALYGVGALVAPADRRRLGAPGGTAVLDADEVRRGLSRLQRRVAGRLPADVSASVQRISTGIRELLDRAVEQPGASEDVFVLSRMACDYLPATVDGYLRLPPTYAAEHRLADGRTPLQMVRGQLELLEGKLGEVRDAMLAGDSDRLAAHGRFLQESFAESTLSLAPPRPPGEIAPPSDSSPSQR
jgi:hypothetical protein